MASTGELERDPFRISHSPLVRETAVPTASSHTAEEIIELESPVFQMNALITGLKVIREASSTFSFLSRPFYVELGECCAVLARNGLDI